MKLMQYFLILPKLLMKKMIKHFIESLKTIGISGNLLNGSIIFPAVIAKWFKYDISDHECLEVSQIITDLGIIFY